MQHEHECEDQGEGVQNSGKTGTGVRGRDMGIHPIQAAKQRQSLSSKPRFRE